MITRAGCIEGGGAYHRPLLKFGGGPLPGFQPVTQVSGPRHVRLYEQPAASWFRKKERRTLRTRARPRVLSHWQPAANRFRSHAKS